MTGLDDPFHAVFIRAPVVEAVGEQVEILAVHDSHPVIARRAGATVASFHPELTGDSRLHAMFLQEYPAQCPATPNGRRSHKKGAADKARGKLFAKLARQIEVAARMGGDTDSNATLRTAVQKAKAGQMTNDAIDRAIKRGTGEAGGENYESIMYEGYAPGGVGLLIEVLTDNRNRSGSDVRSIFSKMGGSMAEPGAVGWQFSRRGVILVDGSIEEDDVMLAALDAGADDIRRDGSSWRIETEPSAVYDVQAALEAAVLTVESADSTMVSSTIIELTSVEDARKVLRIVDALEDNDDVQDVYGNFDISDEILEAVGD
ncbi:MAG: YebC/PmpR family DNA-binding transcriptional regulator [Ilumatobacteraceae bacterium]